METRLAKIVISREGESERQVALGKERVTLGRHRRNDIVLDHPAVSGEHAVIVTILDDSFLEDLHSTNGTYVNGHRIGKHFLQDGDVIKAAKYELRFIADGIRPLAAAALMANAAPAVAPISAPAVSASAVPVCHIEVLNGGNAGKRVTLSKPVTTLGRAGVQVVTITRQADGYLLAHVEGNAAPRVNGAALGPAAHALRDGDVIDLSGTQMAFRHG